MSPIHPGVRADYFWGWVCVHKHIERDKRTSQTPTQASSYLCFRVAELFYFLTPAPSFRLQQEKLQPRQTLDGTKEATRRGERVLFSRLDALTKKVHQLFELPT